MCGDALRSFAPAQHDDPQRRFRAAATAEHNSNTYRRFVRGFRNVVCHHQRLFELFGSEPRYASNFGVSISKCQEIFQIIGTPENGQCSRRVPREHKTEMQLAVEVMVMKIERQDMRGKRPLQPWQAPEGLARP